MFIDLGIIWGSINLKERYFWIRFYPKGFGVLFDWRDNKWKPFFERMGYDKVYYFRKLRIKILKENK